MINLLPPKIKKEQRVKKISLQVSGASFTVLIMIIMTYSAIFFVNHFLSTQLKKNQQQLEETNVKISQLKEIESEVNSINQKINKIDQVKTGRIEWSSFFRQINNAIPEKVEVRSISVDKNKKTFSISAAAETRADIVKLQAKLEDIDILKNMSFQSSVYEDKNNYYTFSMNGSLEK